MDDFGFPHFRKPPHDDNTLEFWKKNNLCRRIRIFFTCCECAWNGLLERLVYNKRFICSTYPQPAKIRKVFSKPCDLFQNTLQKNGNMICHYLSSISLLYLGVCMCLLYIYIYSMYTKSIRGLYCTMCKFGVSPMIAIKLKDREIPVLKPLTLVILPKPSDFRSKIAMENAPAVRRWAPFASISRCQAELVTTHDSTLVIVLWCTFKPWVRGLSKNSGMNHWELMKLMMIIAVTKSNIF